MRNFIGNLNPGVSKTSLRIVTYNKFEVEFNQDST